MKKFLAIILTGTLAFSLLPGCQKAEQTTPEEPGHSITAPQDDKESATPEATTPENTTSGNEEEPSGSTPDSSPTSTPSSTPNPEKPTTPEGSTPSNKPAKPSSTPKPAEPSTPANSASPEPEKTPSKLSGPLEDIIGELYAVIPENNRIRTASTPFSNDDSDKKEYFLGIPDLVITEGVGSEPMMSSIANSLVLIRVPDEKDIQATMDKIKKSVNPRKWICVGVEEENVRVVNHKNLILLIMDENSQAYVDTFKALAK